MILNRTTDRALLLIAGLAWTMTGCATADKSVAQLKKTLKRDPVVMTGSTPGSEEIEVSNRLKDPDKLNLAYGYVHEQNENFSEARRSYEAVVKKNPKNIDAQLGLARLDIQLGHTGDAEQRLLKLQKVIPKDARIPTALANHYATEGEMSKAVEQMALARKLSPYDPNIAHQMGVLQTRVGDLDQALDCFTEAKGPAEAHFNIAAILYEQGDLAQARRYARQAAEMKPNLAEAHQLVAMLEHRPAGGPLFPRSNPNRGPQGFSPNEEIQPAGYQGTDQYR